MPVLPRRRIHTATSATTRSSGIYVEVISFDKLIDDAKRRNAVLFDQLGLGASIKIEVTSVV